ncbi:MAG: NADH-quinone oxidoreductase subunit L [Cyclobacteriaceae bacterium]|nr:NADH-quinone oxidoreductase subunit L [Cyclobacteriaceae bacterium]
MQHLIGYIVLFPFLGFLVLFLLNRYLSKSMVSLIGVGSVGIPALLTMLVGLNYLNDPDGTVRVETWEWFQAGSLDPGITFLLDPLALIFVFIVTFVGFLIHLYSVEFMKNDDGYGRFFAYMNLFIGSMLILVLADNLVFLYLGWEGVGLCSFLLIGFWYRDPENVKAAKKAFVVTRIGDTSMVIGLFLLFAHFQTLEIQELLAAIPGKWAEGSSLATWGSILLLGGAVGKSAQLPLQVWLPDAMAGPSPVSALIHAATMVTAGVYLIARTHVLFLQAPDVMEGVAIIGALTLLIAGTSALTQTDIKKVLAYSTISQIGYMFLALGVGAWSAAVFHFMVHAFFKALLFLAAGAVILAMHHEHNMFKMGGLRKRMPVIFWTFLAGAASLAAVPLITAGFYSKDAILWLSFAGEKGNSALWLAGTAGAFITAVYTFRMIFVTFYGKQDHETAYRPGYLILIPLIVLAVFSMLAGFIEMPHNMAHVDLFSGFVQFSLPEAMPQINKPGLEWLFQGISSLMTLGGIFTAYFLYLRRPEKPRQWAHQYSRTRQFLLEGWKFDRLYRYLVIRPVTYLSEVNREDFIDRIYILMAESTRWWHTLLVKTQNGRVRWYIMGTALGVLLILAIIILI